jgi:hypothetical protein
MIGAMADDSVVFGLAAAGYLLLAKDTALRLAGRRWPALAVATAAAVVTHVALVWALRFEWSLSRAWHKSPAAFVIFHAALALIVATPLLSGRARDRVTLAAFGIVSTGALPATVRYPETGVLAIPLFAAFAAVTVVGVAALRRRRVTARSRS